MKLYHISLIYKKEALSILEEIFITRPQWHRYGLCQRLLKKFTFEMMGYLSFITQHNEVWRVQTVQGSVFNTLNKGLGIHFSPTVNRYIDR